MSLSFDKLLDWWLSPLSGASVHSIDSWMSWHARFMVMSWAFLLPLGALFARYFKVMPKQDWPSEVDNRIWWHAHRSFQYGGVVLMMVGIWLAWNEGSQSSAAAVWHRYLGWIVIALGALQVVTAWSRGSKGGPTDVQMRGDHYDMTQHRLWFEAIHKAGGWLAIALAVATICFGLCAADAPRWMVLALVSWWVLLVIYGFRLQRNQRCIDTYQAIWGPSMEHPGNQRPKIGWGARRISIDKENV
ncbi:MAG: cytochrome b561 domain-containing protein [Burkholderiaceae bacterium]